MAKFVIVMGAAPHMKLQASGEDFSTSGTPMAFDSHDAAYDYLIAQTDEPPLKGVRGEIVEDLSLEAQDPE